MSLCFCGQQVPAMVSVLHVCVCMCVLDGFGIGIPIKKNDRSRHYRNGESVNGTQSATNKNLFKQFFARA